MFPLLSYVAALVQSLQNDQNPQHQLEEYILDKNPQSVADVDYWTKEFDKKQK